jgi:hypothetical protein
VCVLAGLNGSATDEEEGKARTAVGRQLRKQLLVCEVRVLAGLCRVKTMEKACVG